MMEYRTLGRAGVKVAPLALDGANFERPLSNKKESDHSIM